MTVYKYLMEVHAMLRYDYYYENECIDSCDICEEQRSYIIALGFRNACVQIGR